MRQRPGRRGPERAVVTLVFAVAFAFVFCNRQHHSHSHVVLLDGLSVGALFLYRLLQGLVRS